MKPKKNIFLLLFLHVLSFSFAQTKLGKDFAKITIKDGIETFEDPSANLKIDEVLQKNFQKSPSPIPNFGWGKSVGWVRFSVENLSNQNGKVLLHINSAIFDNLNYYLVKDEQITAKYEHLGSLVPPEKRAYWHRDFVFPMDLEPNANYTIYLSGRTQLNNLKFPIEIWQESAFTKSEKSSNLFWGVIIGVFVLVALANFILGFLMQMRTFYYYGGYVASLILVFLNLEGFLYEYLPIRLIKGSFYDIHHLFNYSTFFFTTLFVVSFTKLSLIDKPYFERGFRILQMLFWLTLIPTILNPLWIDDVSDSFLQIWGWIGRILILAIIIWGITTVFASLKNNQMAKVFLLASVPPLLAYIIPQYQIFNVWAVQPYSYLVGFSIEIIILSIAMIFKIRAYIFNRQTAQPNTALPIEEEKIIETPHNSTILTKRETEILKAFANGFTYQEISDAMFISPHTVRTHIKNIYQKLEINSKAEAVRYVMDNLG
ncbi:MAG: 7TM-DISM domain-containing protein [Spirosomataceae bacterium]